MTHPTAILFFARTSEAEYAAKELLPHGGMANIQLFHALSKHSLDIIKKTGLPFFNFNETQQPGLDFGEKITHAFQQVFSLGFKNVIAIGADTPAICTEDLLQAADTLIHNNMVCGATQCGGSYLIGLNKQIFDESSFRNLRWQSPDLFSDLLAEFEDAVVLNALPELNFAEHLSLLKFSATRIKGISSQLISLAISILRNMRLSFYSKPAGFIFAPILIPARAP